MFILSECVIEYVIECCLTAVLSRDCYWPPGRHRWAAGISCYARSRGWWRSLFWGRPAHLAYLANANMTISLPTTRKAGHRMELAVLFCKWRACNCSRLECHIGLLSVEAITWWRQLDLLTNMVNMPLCYCVTASALSNLYWWLWIMDFIIK